MRFSVPQGHAWCFLGGGAAIGLLRSPGAVPKHPRSRFFAELVGARQSTFNAGIDPLGCPSGSCLYSTP